LMILLSKNISLKSPLRTPLKTLGWAKWLLLSYMHPLISWTFLLSPIFKEKVKNVSTSTLLE
jgi:hypothetical protein